MNIDFDGILELSGPASTTLSHHKTGTAHSPSSSSTPALDDPFHFAPTPGVPSMQIERQIAYYHALLTTKESKSKALNAFTTELLGMCPLCWAYQGILKPKHKDRLWIQCRGQMGHGFMHEMGTDRPFKKLIKFPRYKVCWKCHLPQDKFMPPSHPDFSLGQRGLKECPHEDFVVLLVLFIRRNDEWWKRACSAFGLASNMSQEELVVWYSSENVPGGFNNSLELILWLYMEKEKERNKEYRLV